jgi:hypothetical protein
LLDKPLGYLTLGRALLHDASRIDEAKEKLDEAVKGIKYAGNIDQLPHALLARAMYYRYKRKIENAYLNLNDALEYALLHGMDLYHVDGYLLKANLHLDEVSDLEKSHLYNEKRNELLQMTSDSLKEAEKYINQCQYYLRSADLLLAQSRLAYYEENRQLAQNKLEQTIKRINEIDQQELMEEYKRVKSEIFATSTQELIT